MIISKVKVCGFDKIWEGCFMSMQEHRQGFGNGLFTYLTHCMISLELADITTIELFYLNKLASSIKIVDKVYKNFVNEKTNKEIYDKVEGLLQIHEEMLRDDDINKDKSAIDNILPIGCEQYRVLAIYKGSNIASITGALVANMFKDSSGEFPKKYPGNAAMEKKVAELFYKEFYTYISNKMTDIDLVTEFMTNKKYYQYAEDQCSLAHVNTPLGEIAFFANTEDMLNAQVAKIRQTQETLPYYIKDDSLMTFVLNTTFNTFMKLYMNTPFIVDHVHLKMIYVDETIQLSDDIVTKYSARISSLIEDLNEYKKAQSESTEIDLSKFNYIFNGNQIIYSLQLSLSDIDRIEEVLVDEDELISVKEKMVSMSNLIDSLIG